MTAIQWTDETWNPTTGCTRVSEGCRHCYIERTPPFRMHGRKLGDPVQLHPDRLDQPLRWTKAHRIFVNSMSDLFHEDVPDEFIDRVFAVMLCSPRHTFQILTKRPQRMLDYMMTDNGFGRAGFIWNAAYKVKGIYVPKGKMPPPFPYPHVHLGVSVEDQATADERIPILLQTPAAVRFVSAEPLLGPVDIKPYIGTHFCGSPCSDYIDGHRCDCMNDIPLPSLDWVIAGGESGPGARACDVAWIRSIVQQCKAAGVPIFVKQLGSSHRCSHDSKGGCWECMPNDLKVREYPR